MTVETLIAIVGGLIVGAFAGWLWMLEIQHERLRRRLRMSKPENPKEPQRMPTPKPTPTPTPPPTTGG